MKLLINVNIILTTFLLVLYLNGTYGAPTNGPSTPSDGQNEENSITTTFVRSAELENENKSFSYSITTNPRDMFKFPLKIEFVKFNDKVLAFSDGAKLPSNPVSSIALYTCKHGNTILVNIKSQNQNYFYAWDDKSNGWTNRPLHRLKSFIKTDSNGIKYYEHDADEKKAKEFSDKVVKKLSKLSKKSCKKDCSGSLCEKVIQSLNDVLSGLCKDHQEAAEPLDEPPFQITTRRSVK